MATKKTKRPLSRLWNIKFTLGDFPSDGDGKYTSRREIYKRVDAALNTLLSWNPKLYSVSRIVSLEYDSQKGGVLCKLQKKVVLSDEARYALRRKPPTDDELIGWLNSNDEDDMPMSYQARQVAYALLTLRGYEFIQGEV